MCLTGPNAIQVINFTNWRAIADELGISRLTAGLWRKRFAKKRFDGLDDESRCGAPRKIGDEKIAEVVTKTLETLPADATHWSALNGEILRSVNLDGTSHLERFLAGSASQRDFQFSTDPQFVEKVRRRWFAKRPHWYVHFTPTPSSWINQVERFFALLSKQHIKRGAHRSVAELEDAITDYLKSRNAAPKPFRWTKSADDIVAPIERFCRRTLDTHATCAQELQNRDIRQILVPREALRAASALCASKTSIGCLPN